MRRIVASLWALFFFIAIVGLVFQLWHGVSIRSDLTALIPQEDQKHYAFEANDRVSNHFSKKVMLVLGHKDKAHVYAAAKDVVQKLEGNKLLKVDASKASLKKLSQLGSLLYPHRHALLSDANRKLLQEDRGEEIASSALAQAYSVMGNVTAAQLENDPFNLSMDYMTSLPMAEMNFSFRDGFLTTKHDGKVWVLVSGSLLGEPYALDMQDKVSEALKVSLAAYQDVTFYKTGAIFYAEAGAKQALSETTLIGSAALFSTIVLLLLAFRSFYPLVLSVFVIGVGFITALSFSFWFWQDLHVCALLFGISLIGVTVDYSLEYCVQIFSDNGLDPFARLKNVFSGLSLGAATTIIGYVTMMVAPFPGLRQIALFSVIGSLAAWLSVVLWFPYLDKRTKRPEESALLKVMSRACFFCEAANFKPYRYVLVGLLFVAVCFGAVQFHSDDGVRKLQTLSASLKAEEEAIKSLTGTNVSNRFIVIEGSSEEAVLQREEAVIEKLHSLIDSGGLESYQALSSFVPSLKRQKENTTLVRDKLFAKHGTMITKALSLPEEITLPSLVSAPLRSALYQEKSGALSFLSFLYIEPQDGRSIHLIMLEGLTNPSVLPAALNGIDGARFVDVASDYTKLFGKYRYRALMLLAAATFFMLILLAWRYGLQKGFAVILPPVVAVLMTPFICALLGNVFTFFDAIALLLVLSMGLDYSIFYKEAEPGRRHITLLALFLSACTTMMSFGFLAFSTVMAVSNFGLTMLVGVVLSFLLAPFVRTPCAKIKNVGAVSAMMLLLLLPACSMHKGDYRKAPVSIAPTLSITLPSTPMLSEDVDVLQNVVASYGDQTISFQGRIKISKDGFKLVCFDPLGQRVLSAHWTDAGIYYEAASWLPSTLQPENILTDLFLIYWPEAVVKASLSGQGALVAHKNQRVIMQKDKVLSLTDYKKAQDLWQAEIHHENKAWGYKLVIESRRIEP